MTYSIGHTLVTPLPDGRVSYTPCRHCGEECRGHSMAGRLEVSSSASHCRTCGAECPPAQCDACRADGAARARDEERAAVVAWLRGRLMAPSERALARSLAGTIERGRHRS